MGGNALKDTETHRLDKDAYHELVDAFYNEFTSVFGRSNPLLIKAYHSKESYGDADFLVSSGDLPPNWTDMLKEKFNLSPEMYVSNGNVNIMAYHGFQIDLIVTAPENIGASYFYFSYNDFGNIIGRIGHKLGIKFGHTGISLVVRHKDRTDHILREINLTHDGKIALDILGLDRERYERGFDTLEEMFEYVATSKYFDPEIYALENRSYSSRVRDRKRTTYNKFLQWIEDTKPKANFSFTDKSELGGYSIRLPYFHDVVVPLFPWVEDEVNQLISDFDRDLRFHALYNGEVVSKLTGFTGKRLGSFMQRMEPKLTKELKQVWLDNPYIMELGVAQLFLELGGVQFMSDLNA